MTIKTVPVPYRYIQTTSVSTSDCSDVKVRQFVLPVFLYLGFNQAATKNLYISLKHLLKRACGYNVTSGTCKTNYYAELKKALKYLQSENVILNIFNEDTSEVVDIMAVTPSVELYIELAEIDRFHWSERFVRFSYEEFNILNHIESTTHRWKAITLYGYIRAKLGYEVTSGKESFSSWNFTGEHVSSDLQKGFSRHTVDELFDILKECELIYWEIGFVPIKNSKEQNVRRIGKITVLNKNEPLELVKRRFYSIKGDAKQKYITNMNLISQTTIDDDASAFQEDMSSLQISASTLQ